MYLPEVDLKIESMEIKAIDRKLKAVWTCDVSQDIQSFINKDDELMNNLIDEILFDFVDEVCELKSEEKPWGFRKKKRHMRKITEDWEVSKEF